METEVKKLEIWGIIVELSQKSKKVSVLVKLRKFSVGVTGIWSSLNLRTCLRNIWRSLTFCDAYDTEAIPQHLPPGLLLSAFLASAFSPPPVIFTWGKFEYAS